ncbi:hypothetical protein [Nocardia sp. NPDC057668]|uniref:hypothetical protein n=1 Tax=Nocardia sp. NPDC057668 TaxID=3346202 RepID=UPI00366BBC5C
MGIWTDQFLAPYEAYLPDVADFAELATSMLQFQVARPPWTLVAGTLSANAELPYTGILGDIRWRIRDGSLSVGGELATDTAHRTEWEATQPPPWGQALEKGKVLATGTDWTDITPALADAPYAVEDIAIVFDQLDFSDPAMLNHFCGENPNILLTCFALARPQSRPLAANTLQVPDNGPVHPVQTFVSVAFKHGESGYPCPPIADAVVRVLGPGLVIGQTLN